MKKLYLGLLVSLLATSNGYGQSQGQGKRFLNLEDAAVAMAQAWQRGDKARPLVSDDGKIVFAYGQSMPKLTCSPSRACDVEMQPGEEVRDVVLADKANWTWMPSTSREKGKEIAHVIFQPRDVDVESNVIITTDRRTYHIRLFAPKTEGIYLNRVGFYYPDELVQSWNTKADKAQKEIKKEESLRVSNEPTTAARNFDFDYKIDGNASFKPVRVFNNGTKVHIQLPDAVFTSEEVPNLVLEDDEGNQNVVNWHPDPPFYVVDKLFTKAYLIVGKQKVTITAGKKAGWLWSSWGNGS